jgi:cold shock CspA family protein
VAYEPERLQQKFQNPTLSNAINDAFGTMERQLIDMKEQRTRRTKVQHHDSLNRFHGQVAEMHPDEDYGFLLNKDGGLLYFHRNSMLDGDFDALKRGAELHYVEEVGDTGPIATKVWVKAAAESKA